METQRTQTKVAMHYGALYGLSGVIIFLIFYFLGTDIQSKLPQYLSYLMLVIFIIAAIRSYRDNELQGSISYGKALGTGILVAIFGGIISAFFTIIFFSYISPEMVQKILENAQNEMVESGMAEEQLEMAMTWTAKFMTPGWLFFFALIGSAVMGLIFSLIIAAFMRREQNPFNSNIS